MGVREATKNAKIAKVRLEDVLTDTITGEWGSDPTPGTDVFVLRTTNFTCNGEVDYGNVVSRDIPSNKVEKKRLLPGDLIVEKSGGTKDHPVGRVVYFNRDSDVYLCNNFTQAIRPNREVVNSRYLLHVLLMKYSMKSTESMYNKTTGIQNLKMSLYLKQEIPLPSLPEQKRIAEELDQICELKKNADERLALMDQLVKSRFVEMFGDVTLNDRSYEVRALRDLGKWSSGGTPSRAHKEYFEGAIDWYSAGELNDFYLKPSKEKISEEALRESSAKLWPAGSLLVGMYDTAAFKMGYLDKPASSNQACACLMPTVDMEIRWLYCMLQAKKESFLSFRHGCRQKNLSLSQIKEFEIPFPPLALQREFAAFVAEVDKSKFVLRETVVRMETLYKAKLQEYFG